MADGRLRVIGVAPSGRGLRAALAKIVKASTVVTAFEDGKLNAVRGLLKDGAETEIVPLGSLVARLLRMQGQPIGRLVTRGQQRAMVDICAKALEEGSPLAASARRPGLAPILAERLAELRDWGFDAEELDALAKLATPGLAQKLQALAEVERSVGELMEKTNRAFSTDVAHACLDIVDPVRVPLKHLVVLVGNSEKPVYERLLGWTADQGIAVDVLVDSVPDNEELYAIGRRVADRLGCEIEETQKRSWTSALFTMNAATGAPDVVISSTPDPLSEAEWAVRGCLERMAEDVSPNRLCIFARDRTTYAPLVQLASERLGLPLSQNLAVPLTTNGFVRLVSSTLRCLCASDVLSLARLAQSSYVAVSPAGEQELNEALIAASSGERDSWTLIQEWAVEHDEDFPWLDHLLTWREIAISSPAGLAEWLNRFRTLVGGAGMVDLSLKPGAPTSKRDSRAQTVMQRAIADYAYVFDQSVKRELNLREFVELADRLWREETVVIEGHPNGVRFLSNTAALAEYDTLFVIGMLEGNLPRRRSEDPILFDDEREELSKLAKRGVRLQSSHDRAIAERDEFVRLCSSVERTIVLSYPETDEQRDNVPAFYLEDLKRAVGKSARYVVRSRSSLAPAEDECRADADQRLRRALDGDRVEPSHGPLISEDAQALIRPNFEDGVPPAELARSLTCSFWSAMRYRLELYPPVRRRLMNSLQNLPKQIGLAAMKTREEATRALQAAQKELIDGLYSELETWEIGLLKAAGDRLREEWVEREFRARELWRKPGATVFTDVRLGTHGLRNTIPINDMSVRLEDRMAAMTTTDDYSILQFFVPHSPNLTDIGSLPEDNTDTFLYGLYLMTQMKTGQPNSAIEIDSMTGKRTLLAFQSFTAAMPRRPKEGFEVITIDQKPSVFYRKIVDRLERSVAILEKGSMEARPSDACKGCPYGELCRVSSQFGEQHDPFEESRQ